MELHEALADITAIRRQIAQAEQFRGYRAWPVALSALIAFGAAIVQPLLVAEPAYDLFGYLRLWVTVAIVAGMLPVVDVWSRHRDWSRNGGTGSLRSTLTRLACEQFAPCVAVGGLLTLVVACFAPQVGWMLPGLWAIIFSLGLFASCRLLPRAIFVVAAWYLLAGCLCLALGPTAAGLAPWTMAFTFGIGQAATAVVLARQEKESDDGQ